jgi:hypothetical protein
MIAAHETLNRFKMRSPVQRGKLELDNRNELLLHVLRDCDDKRISARPQQLQRFDVRGSGHDPIMPADGDICQP